MKRLWLISTALALAVTSAPALAQSPETNEGYRAAPGRDRASSWTPEAMERAQQVQLPNVDPAAVRAAARDAWGKKPLVSVLVSSA